MVQVIKQRTRLYCSKMYGKGFWHYEYSVCERRSCKIDLYKTFKHSPCKPLFKIYTMINIYVCRVQECTIYENTSILINMEKWEVRDTEDLLSI